MKQYIISFANSFPSFRIPELESLSEMFGVEVDLSNHNEKSPFMIVNLKSDEDAQNLIKRSILAKGIYELWGKGEDLNALHKSVQEMSTEKFESYKTNTFRFDFVSFMGTKSTEEKIKTIETFKYLGFEGKIRLKNPETVFAVLEEYFVSGMEKADKPKYLWFGREVQLSARAAGAVEEYDLKKRKYIGTTSFEAELSLISCNIGQVSPGKIIYDPFTGTGSFLVAGAYFGAYPMGTDIDPRSIRGKGPQCNLKSNFKQYHTTSQFMDTFVMDFTNNAFRSDLVIDSIVCDPPYGVREGLKVCGAKNPDKAVGREKNVVGGELGHFRRDFIAPKKPYELANLLEDLLNFAAERLPVGGRLAFWMPTANDEFVEHHIPQHEKLEHLYALEQEFNKWSRRLVVYVKRDQSYQGVTRNGMLEKNVTSFRKRYFKSFNEKSKQID
ncbi:tRNA guanosine-2'-O-methyltransferase [Metschnikowia bicuspidata var. bicuspidata NRRL YB-4993]|uniref:tRNA (guanine(10)-N(2))-methyltransferase n=1 Tax=Metschnikowia bicuspidata var. bicuspidata NRRL YB-4993 TaxID=869754 RepID=A0A1A0GZB9_9ASCO|nr:tRNA guanosine-2'-O-methyltransferase [Metschnikowia bicuspidata var. bicuspidata NRRL YB-4993]OBA17040.1 tRNA guanosine-2'-O-methyltransferase [Metschnikowia bicuspidata var. bicuspidata NRRL YB-4993]